MTEPADPPPLRHVAVYRTVRGLALSGSRGLPAAGRGGIIAAPAAPLRVSAVLRARPASELAEAVAAEPDGLYEAAGGRDARRYSEPND
jgi:hypothetical protein